MEAGSKGGYTDGEAMGGCSNLTGGFDMSAAIDGRVLAGERLAGPDFVSRPVLFSDVYITATFVDGEFIVPVSDHPIAVRESAAVLQRPFLSIP